MFGLKFSADLSTVQVLHWSRPDNIVLTFISQEYVQNILISVFNQQKPIKKNIDLSSLVKKEKSTDLYIIVEMFWIQVIIFLFFGF